MALTIYHNPRCSKSRKTLELIESLGKQATIVRYLDTPPSSEQLLAIAGWLGVPVAAMLRKGEAAFKEAQDLPALTDDAALATWLTSHPIVIERPIVVDQDNGRAVIGRPPENVLALLDQ